MTIAQILTDVLTFIKHGNWMECDNYLIFGWNEYIQEIGPPEASLAVDEKSAEISAGFAQAAWIFPGFKT